MGQSTKLYHTITRVDSASVAGSPESVSVVGAAVLVADVFQDLITTAVHTFEMAAAG